MVSWFLIIGLLMILLGFIMVLFSRILKDSDTRSGGIVIVGPFPIVFGGRGLKPILIFMVITLFLLVLTLTLAGVLGYV
ncbi:MAG: DUF131 domain-containing protein [Candidatus Caldarchaeales archaeon]